MTKSAKARLLVIEDDIDVQELLAAFFKPKGFDVTIYDNPLSVLNDFENQSLSCDVIITDLKLPEISGIEFTRKLKDLGIETPIILITAHNSAEVALESVQAGAFGFVLKPLSFPQLLVTVERALHFRSLATENASLKAVVQAQSTGQIEGVIGKSPAFKQVLDLAKRVAGSYANVFISGESGTGKEVIAKTIHNLGDRKEAPFVAINCSAIPENLLESELFGFAKGAFTGALDKKKGLFEEAEGGTLFLDEIGDLSLMLQAKLLRVIQEKKIKRIGENQLRDINVRILSATHKDLRKELAEKRFREDLFFRLNVIAIKIPSLRERREDILPLAEHFLKKFAALNGSGTKKFSKEAKESLLANPWRGNVRELENAIERAVVLSSFDIIGKEDLADPEISVSEHSTFFDFNQLTSASSKLPTVDELVNLYVRHVLQKNGGAKEKTAKELSIDRKTLYRRLHA
jgi:two-component system, NtrC family, response regulator HydG